MATIKHCKTRAVMFELDGASMADTLIAALNAGVDIVDADLRGCDLSGIDLSERDLSGIVLIGANLSGASLQYTNLNMANMAGANLATADMRFAKMVGARLNQARLPLGSALIMAGTGRPMFVCGRGTCEVSGYEPQHVMVWIDMTPSQAMEVGGEMLMEDLPRIKAMLQFLGSMQA